MSNIEPKIGDIKRVRRPSGYIRKLVYYPCIDCGKERWVDFIKGKPETLRCQSCARKYEWSNNPKHKEAILLGSKRRWATPGAREKMSARMSGENNHFYGKHHPPELIAKLAKAHEVSIDIKPNKEWGYFIGLVLGDGCISKTNGGNYKVSVASSRPEIVDKFYECLQNLGLHACYEIGKTKPQNREDNLFKNKGEMRYTSVLQSKQVYKFMRPYKMPDFHFKIPRIVYKNIDMAKGFLQGYFDAEGGIYPSKSSNSVNIQCWSKHISNLEQVKKVLLFIGIKSYARDENRKRGGVSARLCISQYKDRLLFRDLVGFRIQRKQDLLNNMSVPTRIPKISVRKMNAKFRNKAEELIRQKVSFKEIATITGVDKHTINQWSYVMRHPERRNKNCREISTYS